MVIATIKDGEAPPRVIIDIVNRLERGEVLILPTDTVYGIHALSRNKKAVDRIRKIKGLDDNRPLTTLFSSVVDIGRFVKLPEGPAKRNLLESWPGPVTWILPAHESMPDHNLGAERTIGIRIPNNQFLRSICSALEDLIVSTSANRHGDPPPSTREEIDKELLEDVDGVVFQYEPLAGNPSEVKRWTPAGSEVLRTRHQQFTSSEHINILVICSGNICRSPMAEGLLRKGLDEAFPGHFVIRSAGISTQPDMRASLPAVEVMRTEGIDLQQHRSRLIDEELIEWSDVVLAMTPDHVSRLYDLFPDQSGKVFLYPTFPDTNMEGQEGIPDPYGGNIDVYQKTADQLKVATQAILPHLRELVV